MITVRQYDASQRNRWNQFVQTARNSHFMFDRGYLEYHADRFSDESLMFEKGKLLVALLPAHRSADGKTLTSHDGLTFAGLIVGSAMRQNVMDGVFQALLGYLREHGFRNLRYRAMPSIYNQYPGEEDLWSLHRLGANVSDVKVAGILKVGGPPDTSQNFRRQVRLAEESGVLVANWDDVERFHELLSTWLAARHQVKPVHTAAELRLLQERFPKNIRILAAKRGSEILGAALFFETPVCVRLQYVANTNEGMTLGVAQIYIQALLDDLPVGKWVDFGTSMTADGDLQASLHAYKESCGARSLLQKTYELKVAEC